MSSHGDAAVDLFSARAAASRANGAKSKGPRTAEGKARASRNALRHGMCAKKFLLLPDDSRAEFAALESALLEELRPEGPLQTLLARRLIAAGHPIAEVNVGGGLGVPARADERPVDPDAYAAAIARQLDGLDVAVGCEPGDYLAKDTAILLAEVVTVEERAGTTFVGLDVGWNVNCSHFIYGYAQELVVCRAADAPRTERVTVAGHINEAGDLFAEDYDLPPVAEGDIVALLNAGGYHQAMSSTHCLRPHAESLFLDR